MGIGKSLTAWSNSGKRSGSQNTEHALHHVNFITAHSGSSLFPHVELIERGYFFLSHNLKEKLPSTTVLLKY